MAGIKKLIINSPYEEPKYFWDQTPDGGFAKTRGRRPAGYTILDPKSKDPNSAGIFMKLPLVNEIRGRVKEWRQNNYLGVTGVTRQLLDYWNDKDARDLRFFWCQLDAIETLIWIAEAPADEKVGVHIPSAGTTFQRLCTKLCTGGGKTTIMAMLIAWQVCNKVAYPQDARFSQNFLIVAPGLTVRDRLKVLQPGNEHDYYTLFDVVPPQFADSLGQARIVLTNWQALSWESPEQLAKKKSVVKKPPLSDTAYARQVLQEYYRYDNWIVINDEAHHAWKTNPSNHGHDRRKRDDEELFNISTPGVQSETTRKEYKDSEAEATVWVEGLERIDRACHIRECYDFSATPFAPSGHKNSGGAVFGWIVSDFGLTDGIESGLVKTPRAVVLDDTVPNRATMRSRLYHIYFDPEVKDDINRKAKMTEPLPSLLTQAYTLLGQDWSKAYKSWQKAGVTTPPVMLTVANRTETASRIEYAFLHQRMIGEPGPLCDKDRILRIDSSVLKEDPVRKDAYRYSSEPENMTATDRAQFLRNMSDTVGEPGKPGQNICNVISVGMLSEGWDTKTVTQILGLRAFSSQLLCEQVIGRGLRRISYDLGPDGLLTPEYVEVVGIPFAYLPYEGDDDSKPQPPKAKFRVESLPEREKYEITWPNIVRIDHMIRPDLHLDIKDMDPLILDATDVITRAELAPILNGNPDLTQLSEINLNELAHKIRLHREVFIAAASVYETMESDWQKKATLASVLGQLVTLTEQFFHSDKLVIKPAEFAQNPLHTRLVIALNMQKIVQHIWNYIQFTQSNKIVPEFGSGRRVWSTHLMQTWFTSKPCYPTKHSQISRCVADSSWEITEGYMLDSHPEMVDAWVKNDHIGFQIQYTYHGIIHHYFPDYLAKLRDGTMLVIETKGQETDQDRVKKAALEDWINAVNETREFGHWANIVSYNVKDLEEKVHEVLEKNMVHE